MSWLSQFRTRFHTGVDVTLTSAVTDLPEPALDEVAHVDGAPIDVEALKESVRSHRLRASLEHSHPIYSDGSLILIGDTVRSHSEIDGEFYEGQVTGITSTSLFCIPMADITFEEGICSSLYLLARAPHTEARALSKLEHAKFKLMRNEPLDSEERRILLEASARRTGI